MMYFAPVWVTIVHTCKSREEISFSRTHLRKPGQRARSCKNPTILRVEGHSLYVEEAQIRFLNLPSRDISQSFSISCCIMVPGNIDPPHVTAVSPYVFDMDAFMSQE